MTANHHPPKISIIIVTYNAAATLQKCLDSIYAQTYPSLEIIVLDGASTDGTVAILEKNKDKIAYWKSEPDKGIYEAMNTALEHFTGEWVYFLGADDVLYPDFSAFAAQLKDHAHVYYGNVMFRGKKHRGEVSAYQHAKGAVCHQAVIYPKEIFTKKGMRFNTKYRIVADHELNMRCWRKFPFRYLDYTIALFNDSGISSTKVDHVFKKDQLKLTFKYHGLITGIRYAIRLMKERRNPDAYKTAPPTDK
jgi:glycosyltransferase involved in cell wall biosynthesis